VSIATRSGYATKVGVFDFFRGLVNRSGPR